MISIFFGVAAAALVAGSANSSAAQQSGQRLDQQPQAHLSPTAQIQGFHVVLVVGETQRGSGGTGQDLPEGAARALNDMREFLPYKQYRVLDAVWSSCCSGSPSRISGRLQGVIGIPAPNGPVNLVNRPYTFRIAAASSSAGIRMQFVLLATGGGVPTTAGERAELERLTKNEQEDVATMQQRVEMVRGRAKIGTATPLELREAEDQLRQARRQLEALRDELERLEAGGETSVMDSSFTMTPGETVVVGTSRLGGDKALIALVTAVRKSGTAR